MTKRSAFNNTLQPEQSSLALYSCTLAITNHDTPHGSSVNDFSRHPCLVSTITARLTPALRAASCPLRQYTPGYIWQTITLIGGCPFNDHLVALIPDAPSL